jgi:tetratricopeptide (TPR) repeat protein
MPGVIGKGSGRASFSVIGESCNLTVEYDWGPPALKPRCLLEGCAMSASEQEEDDADTLKAEFERLYDERRYDEAIPLAERLLVIQEKTLGPEHPDVAKSLAVLAQIYSFQGQDAEAERLLKRSLAIKEKVLGSQHPDTAESLHRLAEQYYDQGRYAEAEPLFKRSLAILEKRLGPDHPYVEDTRDYITQLFSTKATGQAEAWKKEGLEQP